MTVSGPAHPANGPLRVNDYFGDAIFSTGQGVSTISRNLAEKLKLPIENAQIDGKDYMIVVPEITIGTKNYKIGFPMFINEDYSQGLPWSQTPQDVILGNDFMEDMKITLTLGCKILATSELFGTVSLGEMRKVQKANKNKELVSYKTFEDNRVIMLFDMDCFEVQVHEKPHQKGKPRVVVNSSNRILAVSYEAKALSINREATPYLSEAKNIYPNLIAIRVPTRENTTRLPPRPDTMIIKEATARIVNAIKTVLKPFKEMTVFQFSSNDEFYVELTELVNALPEEDLIQRVGELWKNTYLYDGEAIEKPSTDHVENRIEELLKKQILSKLEIQEIRLIFGSYVATTIVQEILNQTTYQSSVGIGSNKLIAKLASSMHKPGSITIVAPSGFHNFAKFVKTKSIPGLGAKLGDQVRRLFEFEPTMEDLMSLTLSQLAGCPAKEGGEPMGLEKAKSILYKANGLCNIEIVPMDFYKTSGISCQLYAEYYTYQEIRSIILQLLGEFLEKMKFEAHVNSRIPIGVNLKICGDRGNCNANLELKGSISSDAENLLHELLSNSTPQLITYCSHQLKMNSVFINAKF